MNREWIAKRYVAELSNLSRTFSWAVACNIEPLKQGLEVLSTSSLRVIGSGGSLTACHALVSLHQRLTRQVAAVATPLEAVSELVDNTAGIWLISAGGSNVDILSVLRRIVLQEPRQIAVLCGRRDSSLVRLCQKHPFVDLFVYPLPHGKDGFLATNSLFGFTAILGRAYAAVFDGESDWIADIEALEPLLNGGSEKLGRWERVTAPIWKRSTTLVLYGPATRIGAIDLESKFTEAALGNVQISDYRNFAHGRHNWLAKQGATSAVVAFVTEQDRQLAERTLSLLPPEVPQARLNFPDSLTGALLASLLAALHLTGWAGTARRIDPGRPKVPEFGRRLYRLSVRSPSRRVDRMGLSARDAAAIMRKAGRSLTHLSRMGEVDGWRRALATFRNRLKRTTFAGVVLDYDGTIVDTRRRWEKPIKAMVAELVRIAESGAWLAVATGRGVSVRKELQSCIPTALLSRVIVGYYNGAEVSALDDDNAPDGSHVPCKALVSLSLALRDHPELATAAEQTHRRFQITLVGKSSMPNRRLWELAHHVVDTTCSTQVTITHSSHSIDILAPGVSKTNVVSWLGDRLGAWPLLTIGDSGRWPGNDYELLQEKYSLSVDSVSVDTTTCWNLAIPGQRGVAATLDYLSSIDIVNGFLRFNKRSLR